MKLREFLMISVCVLLLGFFALACCCPMAFPTGDWPDSYSSGTSKIAMPRLEVTAPAEGAVTDNPQIEVSGYTDSDAKVTVNGQEIKVFSDGSFKGVVDLQSGENELIFTAVRSGGDPAIREVNVISNCSS